MSPTRAVIRTERLTDKRGQRLRTVARAVEITDPDDLAELERRARAHAKTVSDRRTDERTLNARQLFRKRWRQRLADDPGDYRAEIRAIMRRLMAADGELAREAARAAAIDEIVDDEWRDRNENDEA